MSARSPFRETVIDLGGRKYRQVGIPGGPSGLSVALDAGPAGASAGAPGVSVFTTTVPGGGGWGDGAGFRTRPKQFTQIDLNGVNGVTISNLYFDNSALDPDSWMVWRESAAPNAHVCIRIRNSTNVTVRYVDFEEVSQPIEVYNSDNVLVEYCRMKGLVGPASRFNEQTGNFLQTHGGCNNVAVENCKLIATTGFQSNPYHWPAYDYGNPPYPTVMMGEDIISFYGASYSGARYCEIDGTGYLRDSGTGVILGDQLGIENYVRDCWVLNGGQVGINVVGGYDHLVDNNRVWADSYSLHNQCMVHYQYQSNPLGGVTFSNNRTYSVQGRHYWASPQPAVSVNNVYGDGSLNRADFVVTL